MFPICQRPGCRLTSPPLNTSLNRDQEQDLQEQQNLQGDRSYQVGDTVCRDVPCD